MLTVTHDPTHLVFGGAVVVYLIIVVALSNRLKRYPVAWDASGRFLLFMNNTPVSGWRFLKFIFSDGYKPLEDRQVFLMVWALRLLLIACGMLFLWNLITVYGD